MRIKTYCKHHPNKHSYGHGLCRTCWDRERKWKTRGVNINTDEYNILLKKQGGLCLFCDRQPRPHRFFDVDHSHKTGKVRGLLCNEHNRALGVIEKNIDLVHRMLQYIQNNGPTDEAGGPVEIRGG